MVRSPVVSATPTLVNVDMHDLSAPEPKSATPTLSTGAECRTRSSSQEEDVEKGDRGLEFPYAGAGNSEDPFVVRWLENDPEYPHNWSDLRRYTITLILATCTLAVAFGSSLYAGAVPGLTKEFKSSGTVITLGLSLYVLGFALGPLIFAPFSEVVGRRTIFLWTAGPHALFIVGSACAQNIETLLITRFLAGFLGSSPLNNSAAAIGDIFNASERAVAMSLFAASAFAGPVLGPIAGGFMGESISWRWVFWVQFIFASLLYVLGAMVVPETYTPVLLRRRALKLTKSTGFVHTSEYDLNINLKESTAHKLLVSSYRPFLMLVREAIVLCIALYVAVVYGILYLMFGAFPIVFQETRGWSEGMAGLPFIGVGIGMMGAVVINLQVNKKYARDVIANGGSLPPEARLPPACFGGVCLPVGLFWFAWTVQPSVHFIVPCIATIPFGLGMVLVFLSLTNYTVDAYLMWAASALAANAVFRSIFGTVFPLFTTAMFHRLGNSVALTILASLTLALVPIPFVLFKYGPRIRQRSTYAPGHKAATDLETKEQVAEADLRQTEDLQETVSRMSANHV